MAQTPARDRGYALSIVGHFTATLSSIAAHDDPAGPASEEMDCRVVDQVPKTR
jgi:hypothetical protein